MSRRLPVLLLAALAATLLAAPAPAAAAPLYDVKAGWGDTNLPPGGEAHFDLQARNLSEQTGSRDLTIEDQLPAGVKLKAIYWLRGGVSLAGFCSGLGTETLTCTLPASYLAQYAPGRGDGAPPGLGAFSATPTGYLAPVEADVEVPTSPPANPAANRAILYGGSGTLPGGGACAQEAAQLGALPPCADDEEQVPFSPTPAPFGLVPGGFAADFFDAEYPAGAPSRQAGAHPFELRVDFDITSRLEMGRERPRIGATAPVKTVETTLPRGLIGNPEALPKCDPVAFAQEGAEPDSTGCPANTQVGYIDLRFGGSGAMAELFTTGANFSRIPVYSLKPPRGQLADFAFSAAGFVQAHIYPTLAPLHKGYVIKAVVPNISALGVVSGSETTFWGVPADPAHDFLRYYPSVQTVGYGEKIVAGAPFEGPIRPFFTNPTDCGEANGGALIRIDSYTHPGEFTPTEEYASPDNVEGCEDPRFRFAPEVALQPTDRHAGAPTGLDVKLEVPQQDEEVTEAGELYEGSNAPNALATPPLKRAVVTLPEGMSVNPSAAQGLGACTLAQFGISAEGVPNEEPVRCPDASIYGTLRLESQALPQDRTIAGRIYVAKPYANPFGSFLALYLAFEEPELGLLVKIAGEVRLDPKTGQITTEFDGLPQLPSSEVELKIKSGVRAGLVEPRTCGRKAIEATFYSWQAPSVPHPAKSFYEIEQNPDGSPCHQSLGERPFDPQLSGGTENNLAGSFSPLDIEMSRTDEDQDLLSAEGTAPSGLTASLKGITRCTDAQIEAAAAPGRLGTEEIEHPSCPADSQVGTVQAGAGVGQALTYVEGKLYLAGPYEGAPVSGVAIVPAVAGPFDLGTVVTRAPAYVNPRTARITLKTDPIPQIFKGVPLHTRDIRVHLDRPGFTLNPTSCEEMAFTGTLFSTEGKSKALDNRFQAADCASRGFHPRLALRLRGGTRRGAHPALTAVVHPRRGDANIARAAVTLPHSAFLDQGHIRTICTRTQFAAGEGDGAQCPRASIYGYAKAWSPLLEEPFQGPVFLRSSSHNLPDMVAALRGPASTPIAVELDGRIDSVGGGIRNTFEVVPDAPVTRFVLRMQGGRKGLIVNSTNLCAGTHRATAKLRGQNGRRATLRPALRASCPKLRHRRHPRHRRL